MIDPCCVCDNDEELLCPFCGGRICDECVHDCGTCEWCGEYDICAKCLPDHVAECKAKVEKELEEE